MPNWCFTNLDISGEEQELKRFFDSIEKKTNDYGTEYSIISSLYPCPKELTDTVSGWSADENEQAEREKRYAENIAKYGSKDWYDWQYTNWGTKWGDYSTTSDYDGIERFHDGSFHLQFRFETAWGPATEAWIKISKDFPSLRFQFSHQEESDEFAGVEVVRNGELVFVDTFSPNDFEVPMPDYDSDEWAEWQQKQSQWKLDVLDGLEMEASKA